MRFLRGARRRKINMRYLKMLEQFIEKNTSKEKAGGVRGIKVDYEPIMKTQEPKEPKVTRNQI